MEHRQAEHQQSPSSDTSPGLIEGLAAIARNIFGLFISRIELAALELSEVRNNLLKIFLIAALGIVAAWFAIIYWTALVVFLAWQSLGWTILLIFAVVFTLSAVGIFFYVQSMLKQGKLSMSTTMAELRNDGDALL